MNTFDNGTGGQIWRLFAQSLTTHTRFLAYLEPVIQWFLPAWSTATTRARILAVRDESNEVFTLVLQPSRSWKGFEAGQHVELTIEKDGTRYSRIFSISSSPTFFHRTKTIELSIRVQEKGSITPWLKGALATGQYVGISKAYGDFKLHSTLKNESRPVLMLAGGSGITPFRSMLIEHKDTLNMTLIYFARGENMFLFRSELEALSDQHPNIRVVLIDSTHSGHLSRQLLEQHCEDFCLRDIYVCGPPRMIHATQHKLEECNIPSDQIHVEYFGPTDLTNLNGSPEINTSSAIHFMRSNMQVTTPENSPDTILNIAEQAGLKPWHGCRAGVCHQCICKKKRGVVYNAITHTYSDTGPEDIQICISVPAGPLELEL